MRMLIVTGKPEQVIKQDDRTGIVAQGTFVLTERYWDGVNAQEIRWLCIVPVKQIEYMQRKIEKGYTVAITAARFEVTSAVMYEPNCHGWLVVKDIESV